MKNKINVQLSEIDNGGLQQRFENELARVIENIIDPNTDPDKKRKIQINIEVVPKGNRDDVALAMEVKSTLLPRRKVYADVLIDTDGEGVYANELRSGVRGQTYFDPTDSTLKTDEGEPIEKIEEKELEKSEPSEKESTVKNKIHSFRQKA
ncbi:hypothetical protein [Enterococcus sp. DIV1314a]|uniref:hypothetical protein n=1 Tax=Enterococcus sp. DIV1314a TaxID=2774660 RepID=UPI003F29F0A4